MCKLRCLAQTRRPCDLYQIGPPLFLPNIQYTGVPSPQTAPLSVDYHVTMLYCGPLLSLGAGVVVQDVITGYRV